MNQNHGCEPRSKPNCHRTQTFSLPHHLNSKWAKLQIRNMILHQNNKENQQSPHLASHLFITSLYFQSNDGQLHFHQHQVFMFSCADKKHFLSATSWASDDGVVYKSVYNPETVDAVVEAKLKVFTSWQFQLTCTQSQSYKNGHCPKTCR